MLIIGTFLGNRYEIIEQIGTGGMSDVYKAVDHSLNRDVAIKVLKSEFAEDTSFVTKFRAEAQAAAALEHPNIVNIYDVGSQDGLYYIVMEYVEGITLKTYIEKKGRLGYNEALSISIQVGRGIEAAHNKGIVHQDIKPQNIMISKEGKVKVTDFGIARAASSNTIHADTMGSVHYISPEQARNGYVTYASDIYSLGIVMYEMVTGHVPFDGDNAVAIAIQHIQTEMTPPTAYVPDLPISVVQIIKKCTMKSADRRYRTMGDLLVDLKKALINPDENFVVIPDASDNEKTRAITQDEINAINRQVNDNREEENQHQRARFVPPEKNTDDDDDDDSGRVNKKMDKAVTIMGIAAAVIIVIIVVYLFGSFFGLFRFSPKNKASSEETSEEAESVEVPNLLGMTEDEAKQALSELGLGYSKAGEASSDKYDEGQIMSQSVKAGETVEPNTTIDVTVSNGKGDIDIPSVVDLSQDEAESELKDAGFDVNVEFDYSAAVEQGHVISQSPDAGSQGKEGDTITITVSRGVESVTVPNVLGESQKDAVADLKSAGLVAGDISTEYSDDYPEGQVMSQSVDGGSDADSGSSVDLVISKGKETKYYSFSASVDPVNGTETYVVLVDANGSQVASWVVGSTMSIKAKDITTSTGTLYFYDNEDRETQLKSSEDVEFTEE